MRITIPVTQAIVDGLAAGQIMTTGSDEIGVPGGVLQIELVPSSEATADITVDLRYPATPEHVDVGDRIPSNEDLVQRAGGSEDYAHARTDYPIAEPTVTGMEHE